MKRAILLSFVIVLTFVDGFSQNQSDNTPKYKIQFVKNETGQAYIYRGIRIKLKEIPPIVKNNSEAFQLAKQAYNRSSNSRVIGFIGGFLMGFQLVRFITGEEPNWVVGGIGGALVVAAIPLWKSADGKMQKAVQLYNNGLEEEPLAGYQLVLAGSPHGVGLLLRF